MIMQVNRSILLFILSIIIGMTLPLHASDLDKNTLIIQIDRLEENIHKARKEQAVWRDTDNLINQARELLAAGDFNKAQEIISLAEFQLKQSIEQSNSQSDLTSLVPYYLKQ